MEITIVVLAAVVVGLVEAIKKVGVGDRFLPLIALGLGVLVAIVGAELIGLLTWQEILITGLVLGLSSMGLYSGGKALTNVEKTDNID